MLKIRSKQLSYFGTLLLVSLGHLCLQAQTTLELDEFNTAYLRYGESKDSEPAVAREAARRAFELGKELFGESSERTAMLAINYATLIDDETTSQTYLDEAIETYQLVFGFGSIAMIDPLMRLGRSLSDQGREHLATQYYHRALRLAKIHLGEESSKVGSIHLELAAIDLREGALERGWEILSKAKSILVNHHDAGSQSGLVRIDLLTGEYLIAKGQHSEAIVPLLASLEKFNRYPSSNVTIRNRIALIKAYESLGDQQSATEHCLAIGITRRLTEEENLTPVYSPMLEVLRNRAQPETVRVEFLVDKEGFVRNATITSPLNDLKLEQALLMAINKFRFAPRFMDGSVVESPNQYYLFD